MARASLPPASRSSIAAAVGLCADCRHAIHQASARGHGFWRCGRARSDARFLKYPPLPVRRCAGHEPEDHATPNSAGGRHKDGPETTSSG